jgi:hypothetical protein
MIEGVCGQAQLWQTSLGDAMYWQRTPSQPSGQLPLLNALGKFPPGGGHLFKYSFRMGVGRGGGHGLTLRGT